LGGEPTADNMETKQAIQTSANVIRITSVSAGDVYKRFDESYSDRVYFGLVKAVHNDGVKTFIEATEYQVYYSSLNVDFKVLTGDKDYALFPATPEELNLELAKARSSQLKEIENAEEKIAKSQKLVAEIDSLMSGQRQQSLKAMSYKELSQDQYNERMAALN